MTHALLCRKNIVRLQSIKCIAKIMVHAAPRPLHAPDGNGPKGADPGRNPADPRAEADPQGGPQGGTGGQKAQRAQRVNHDFRSAFCVPYPSHVTTTEHTNIMSVDFSRVL